MITTTRTTTTTAAAAMIIIVVVVSEGIYLFLNNGSNVIGVCGHVDDICCDALSGKLYSVLRILGVKPVFILEPVLVAYGSVSERRGNLNIAKVKDEVVSRLSVVYGNYYKP